MQAGIAHDAQAADAAITRYCVRCHSKRTVSGGFSFDSLSMSNVASGAAEWERVIRKLRAEAMPPIGMPRPDQETYHRLVGWLESELDRAALSTPQPGRTETFHRLNRVEYQNAIRDLLSVEVDAAALLPADNTYEHGFDNNGDVLSLSPDLLNRYLLAARRISRLAVGTPPAGPVTETYRVHPSLVQDERVDDDLPFGTRGGIAIRHHFPVDGEYEVTVRFRRSIFDAIHGLGAPNTLDIRLDGVAVKQFVVGGAAPGQMAPLSFTGYIAGSDDWERYLVQADDGLRARFKAKAGRRILGVSFVRNSAGDDGILQPRQRDYGLVVDDFFDGRAAVEHVVVGGPYTNTGPGDTPSRRAVFSCRPADGEEEACAARIVSRLARQAFRRPISEVELREFVRIYREGALDGGFEGGVQLAIERLLVDPDFLYRIEREPVDLREGEVYKITDLELASRLSFFLWSSIPDDELLKLAEQGRLRDPRVLERQVHRMLNDRKANALVENFAAQWLRLRSLDDQFRETGEFPDFDENLRDAFRTETKLFVGHTIQEDKSVVELLSANYTFANERLARHYGIPGVYGNRFRRVDLPPDTRRGGLLGHGSILMVTSHPNRTSPVLRGKWLMESILGVPPAEPPANVPGLPDRGEGGKVASVRERLEMHRRNPVCASCHAPMDPLGFALENFDAIGAWRDVGEGGTAIDASGTMPSGTRFDGPAGLKALLLARRHEFATTVTEKLFAYALGRGLSALDQPAVRAIARGSASEDYRWSGIVLGIVQSVPFQMRNVRVMAPATSEVATREVHDAGGTSTGGR
ncbi:MAG: DUF1592 domain-containing protein [Vicinamibacterales bacterium]